MSVHTEPSHFSRWVTSHTDAPAGLSHARGAEPRAGLAAAGNRWAHNGSTAPESGPLGYTSSLAATAVNIQSLPQATQARKPRRPLPGRSRWGRCAEGWTSTGQQQATALNVEEPPSLGDAFFWHLELFFQNWKTLILFILEIVSVNWWTSDVLTEPLSSLLHICLTH